jgi:ubiquinol-cytochrome c reductase iron-sulfur subunit
VATTTADHGDIGRRDFIFIATGAVGAVGAALTAWPLINQMNPDASVLALSSVEVDLTPIAEGQGITIKWRGNPVFIRHRTQKEIDDAKAVQMADLRDTNARNGNLMGVCTHLGCVPIGQQGDFGGWLCPCHGSHYDTAGRIRKGPAPENLAVPKYQFLTDTKIRIG